MDGKEHVSDLLTFARGQSSTSDCQDSTNKDEDQVKISEGGDSDSSSISLDGDINCDVWSTSVGDY
jgi:hypothetical protein